MNKYRRLLGSSRGGHFKEPRRKKLKFTSAQRRQSLSLRGRYGKLLLQRMLGFVWSTAKIIFIAGTAAWGVSVGIHAVRETKIFQLKSVVFDGNVPDGLPAFLPFKEGQSMFSLAPSKWESAALGKFSEIENISIYRTLMRNVVVEVKLRTPVAQTVDAGLAYGVDKNGVVFPVKEFSTEKIPTIHANHREGRATLVSFLSSLKAKAPELHEKVELLSFQDGRVELGLGGGIVVDWGPFDEKNIFDQAKNILRLLSEFSPAKVPAKLRFVTKDRIVMDAHWRGKEHGKT